MKNRAEAILGNAPSFAERFFDDYEELGRYVEYFRSQGKRIVVTQGVYDLMHMGHILYLEKAKSLGDILIVGIDSDKVTKARKGPHRPAEDEQERAHKLAYSRIVDIVFLKKEDKPLPYLVQVVRPDVLVASNTTSEIEQIKSDCGPYCGIIEVLPAQSTNSTSAKIRNLTIAGGIEVLEEIVQVIEKHKKRQIRALNGSSGKKVAV